MADVAKRLANLSPDQKELLLKKLREQHREKQEQQTTPTIPRAPRNQPLPLSFGQEQIWLLSQFEGGNSAYNIPTALQIQGALQIDILERSVNLLIARHDALRTAIEIIDDFPKQILRHDASILMDVHDLRSFSNVEQEKEIQNRIAEEAQRPFDLRVAPLLRVSLLQLASQDYLLIVVIHHIISDGWSMGVFVKELLALYDAISQGNPSPLSELPFQYGDFTQWQRERLQGQYLDKLLNYWKNRLSGKLPLLQLPTDHPRPPRQNFRGATQTFTFSGDLTIALNRLSIQAGVTLFMTVLAAFDVLLYRYSGQEDIIVGVPIANRKGVEFEAMIGLFMNTLALRADLSGNPTFFDVLSRVRRMTLDAQEHQELPFAQLIAALHPERDMSHAPVYQHIFAFENMPMPVLNLPHIKLTPLPIFNQTAKVDCALVFTEIESCLSGFLEYNTDIFNAATIERMLEHFRILLEGIVANPNQRIAEIPLLTAAERQLFLPSEETLPILPSRCMHQFFEEQADRRPDAIALTFGNAQMTYQQLNRKANQVAHYLRQRGVGPEVMVGICMERSFEMIIGVLGVLKAGGTYLPLDPAYPQERLNFMIQDSRLSLLLTQAALREKLLCDLNLAICCLDADWPEISLESDANIESGVTPDNLAYVIYTSGSTGQPKGVLVTHAGIPNLAEVVISTCHISEQSRVLQFASLSFDASVYEMATTFLAGATLCLANKEQLLPNTPLLRIIREQSITMALLPPSVLTLLEASDIPALQTIVSGGEACSAEIIRKWSSERQFVNAYGPTEATVCATFYPDVNHTIPFCLGYAMPNVTIYILNSNLQICPIGVPGELHIGGIGLARGYLNRPELTAEKFIANPFARFPGERLYKTGDLARYLPDGRIDFLGRIDHQVKIRGYRIELGEIESVLKQHPSVSEAIAITRQTASGDTQLLAYVVFHVNQSTAVGELRDFMKRYLPEYMLPAIIIPLANLPLTPNGKIDRQALPLPETERIAGSEQYAAPRTELERILADIWSNLFHVEKIGIHDDFFDIGGHSLLTVTLIVRLKNILHVDLLPRDIFEAPTIARLAERIHLSRQSKCEEKSELPVDFEAEIMLDPSIIPHVENIKTTASVFLTGATGFLGAFLLYELLRHNENSVFCLVRAATVEEGKNRIRRNLEAYQIWDVQFEKKIFPVIGDLSQPLFGLSLQQFDELAERISMIYHNGAVVNFLYPYAALKNANVLSTQEVLRLAVQKGAIPVHYISTLSVFDSPQYSKNPVIYEQEQLTCPASLQTGYAQSKWVAEHLVMSAGKRGVPVVIYRPGRISGHSLSGVCNTADLSSSLLKGCIQLGYAPDQAMLLDVTPVDYASQAITYLARQQESYGKVFHIVNPKFFEWKQFVAWLAQIGYQIQLVPYPTWQAELMRFAVTEKRENALYPFLPMFLGSGNMPSLQRFDCQQTLRGLEGSNINCPPPNERLFQTYFTYFIQSGFLSPPPQRSL